MAGPLRTKSDFPFPLNILKWYFVTKTVRKNCSSDREKLLKFEAEGQEFASLEPFIQTVKGLYNFW